MSKKEVYKNIKGYEGLYQVSNKGNIKSLLRRARNKNGHRVVKEKILLASLDGNGYKKVRLCREGVCLTRKVHQLVAVAFLHHSPCGFDTVVDHVDDNPLNNESNNLQLVSHRYNISKSKKGSSKYTGVCWAKKQNKWGASIQVNGKSKHLGYFTNELEAGNAYKNELIKL